MSKDNLNVPILEEDQENEEGFQPRTIDLKADIGEEDIWFCNVASTNLSCSNLSIYLFRYVM